jgi:hypothetical protein
LHLEPSVAVDARVDQRVVASRGECGIQRKTGLDGPLVRFTERRQVDFLEGRSRRRVGRVECLECDAEQVQVVAMIVGDVTRCGFAASCIWPIKRCSRSVNSGSGSARSPRSSSG